MIVEENGWTRIMNAVLKKVLTVTNYNLWLGLLDVIEPVWDRPSSSSLKYHKRDDGSVPSIAEHTVEMLIAADKIKRMFGNFPVPVEETDALFLGIALHDAFKYGMKPEHADHTVQNHDKLAGDFVLDAMNDVFIPHLGKENAITLEKCVRYHSGRWSTDASKAYAGKDDMVFVWFVHALDMLSTADKLKLTPMQIGEYLGRSPEPQLAETAEPEGAPEPAPKRIRV